MTLFEFLTLAVLGLGVLNGLYWIAGKLGQFKYLGDDEIEQRIREANESFENRPRIRAITKE